MAWRLNASQPPPNRGVFFSSNLSQIVILIFKRGKEGSPLFKVFQLKTLKERFCSLRLRLGDNGCAEGAHFCVPGGSAKVQ